MEEEIKGTLVIIGGAEDKENDCTILKTLAELTKKNGEKIVILTVAAEYPEKVGKEYTEIFNRLNIGQIDTVHIETREESNHYEHVKTISDAACVFFTGGDQLKITSLIGGTKAELLLKERFRQGLIIAGTSAGASAMSETMITSGNDDDTPKKCTLKMAPGLGLIKNMVIDQHFAQRGRIGRLLSAIAQNPNNLGIGIDEDTAIIAKPNQILDIIGTHGVTIIDGKECSHTNVSELKPDETLAITNITLHILPNGYSYNLINRTPIRR